MKALRYENGELKIADMAKPIGDGETVVRVTLSGICNTDLEIARGYAGFQGTIGHEFVGVIVSASAARPSASTPNANKPSLTVGLVPGQRVVGEINAGCGICDLCSRGDPRHCPQRTVLGIVGRDGAHAEFLKLPTVNLLPVPDEIPDERAVFTEPLAAACGILERAEVSEDTGVGVIGDGKLGLLCAQVLATTGAGVTLIGAKSRTLKFDLVVEASGSPSGFQLALDLLRPRGVLVLKSTFHGAAEMNAARIVVDEISVVGSRCGRFAPALELLRSNAIDVESLISEEFALANGVRAMERAATPGVVKVLLRP